MPEGLSPQSRIDLGPDSSWFEPDQIPSSEQLELATEVRKMLMSEPFLEASVVCGMVGVDKVERLVHEGKLLAYKDHGDYLFPAFQFDSETGQPLEVVTRINGILDAPSDGWGVTGWWVQTNGWLRGHQAPKEYLANPDLHATLIQLAEGVGSD